MKKFKKEPEVAHDETGIETIVPTDSETELENSNGQTKKKMVFFKNFQFLCL